MMTISVLKLPLKEKRLAMIYKLSILGFMSIIVIICATKMVAELDHFERMGFAEVIKTANKFHKKEKFSKDLKMVFKKLTM